jgi:hypothetical protein
MSKTIHDMVNRDVFDAEASRMEITAKKYQVPPHQRFSSWPLKMKIALVDSVMRNMAMGAITLTRHGAIVDDELISYCSVDDGQGRLFALQGYYTDKFEWNGKLYSELSEEEKNDFRYYQLRIEEVSMRKTPDFSKEENERLFKEELVLNFIRLNNGKTMTAEEKYHAMKEVSKVVQVVYSLKKEAEFKAKFSNYMGTIGEPTKFKMLADMVGVVLAILTVDSDRLTTSYERNGSYTCGPTAYQFQPDGSDVERVRVFFRYYFKLLEDAAVSTKNNKKFGKIGVIGVHVHNWINNQSSLANDNAMWVDYIKKSNDKVSGDKFVKDILKTMNDGALRNCNGKNLDEKVECIKNAYYRMDDDEEEDDDEHDEDEDEDSQDGGEWDSEYTVYSDEDKSVDDN